jgi:hypothetical protein
MRCLSIYLLAKTITIVKMLIAIPLSLVALAGLWLLWVIVKRLHY